MRALVLVSLAACSGCATPPLNPPSLAPRSAEAIDPRVPIPDAPALGPVTPAIAARLAALIAEAHAGESAFAAAAADAERLASAAGEPQSESWVAAQQALSAAVAARAPVTRALGDIDAVGSAEVASKGGLSRADQEAIMRAAAAVGEIDKRQAALIDRLQRRLGG